MEGKLILIEVEPDNPQEEHIRLHVTKLAVMAGWRNDVEKLVWVIYSDAPRCHETLKYYAERWKGVLQKISRVKLPAMEYRDRKGRLLST